MTTARVVMLHSIGLDGQAYDSMGALLPPEFEFTACDQRGHGSRATENTFVLSDLVDDAVAEVQRLPRSVHLVGHSMGGCIAALAAARLGKQVASLTLMATPPYGMPVFADRAQAVLQNPEAAAQETLARWFAGESAPSELAKVTAWRAMQRATPAAMAAAWNALASFGGYETIAGRLPRTLCIAGTADASTPPAAMTRIVEARLAAQPGAEIRLLSVEGAGHMFPLTHPRQVALMLAAHLSH